MVTFPFDRPSLPPPGQGPATDAWVSEIKFTNTLVFDYSAKGEVSNPPAREYLPVGWAAKGDATVAPGYKLVMISPKERSLVYTEKELPVNWTLYDPYGYSVSLRHLRARYLLDGQEVYEFHDLDPFRQSRGDTWSLDTEALRDGKVHKLTVQAWVKSDLDLLEESKELALPPVETFIKCSEAPTITHIGWGRGSYNQKEESHLSGQFSPPEAKVFVNGQPLKTSGCTWSYPLPNEGFLVPLTITAELAGPNGSKASTEVKKVHLGPDFIRLDLPVFVISLLLFLLVVARLLKLLTTASENRPGQVRACPRWLAVLPFGAFALVSRRRWELAWWLSAPLAGLLAAYSPALMGYAQDSAGLLPFYALAWVTSLMTAWLAESKQREVGPPRRLGRLLLLLLAVVGTAFLPGVAQLAQRRYKAAWIIAVLAFVAWLPASVVSLVDFSDGSIAGTLAWHVLYALSAWPPLALWLTAILDAFLFDNRLRHSSAPATVQEAVSL
jgi:hypothetical protein